MSITRNYEAHAARTFYDLSGVREFIDDHGMREVSSLFVDEFDELYVGYETKAGNYKLLFVGDLWLETGIEPSWPVRLAAPGTTFTVTQEVTV